MLVREAGVCRVELSLILSIRRGHPCKTKATFTVYISGGVGDGHTMAWSNLFQFCPLASLAFSRCHMAFVTTK